MSYNLPFTKCLHPVKVKTFRGIQLVKCGKCPACENSLRSELRAKVQYEEKMLSLVFLLHLLMMMHTCLCSVCVLIWLVQMIDVLI